MPRTVTGDSGSDTVVLRTGNTGSVTGGSERGSARRVCEAMPRRLQEATPRPEALGAFFMRRVSKGRSP
jgi:hypothetical protein